MVFPHSFLALGVGERLGAQVVDLHLVQPGFLPCLGEGLLARGIADRLDGGAVVTKLAFDVMGCAAGRVEWKTHKRMSSKS